MKRKWIGNKRHSHFTWSSGNKTFDIKWAGGWWFWGWRWCYFKHELWKTKDKKFYISLQTLWTKRCQTWYHIAKYTDQRQIFIETWHQLWQGCMSCAISSNNGTQLLFSSVMRIAYHLFKYVQIVNQYKNKNTGSHSLLRLCICRNNSKQSSSPFINQNSHDLEDTFTLLIASPFNKHHKHGK